MHQVNATIQIIGSEPPNLHVPTSRSLVSPDSAGHSSLSSSFRIKINKFHALAHTPIPQLNKIIERCYDVIALALIIPNLLDRDALVFHFGDLTFAFRAVAGYLSLIALKAVIRQLGQMLQRGLTGFVSGEVVDVRNEYKVLFTFGVRMVDL